MLRGGIGENICCRKPLYSVRGKYVLNPPVNVIEEVTCECNMRNGRGKGGKDNAI